MSIPSYHELRKIALYTGRSCFRHPEAEGLRRVKAKECVECALRREAAARRRARIHGVPYAADTGYRRALVAWRKQQSDKALWLWVTAP